MYWASVCDGTVTAVGKLAVQCQTGIQHCDSCAHARVLIGRFGALHGTLDFVTLVYGNDLHSMHMFEN